MAIAAVSTLVVDKPDVLPRLSSVSCPLTAMETAGQVCVIASGSGGCGLKDSLDETCKAGLALAVVC